ncbi:adenylate/guanylate cyclase domain-containing protein [Antrihabitans cavernicola]|uniref:Adenylate/guanylate cyclase domain-containing protein n=1 Tax=Antrihabitans cavernicola TaxID=2495913 RepID=A0A5A7S1I0_9NOCA|nr:adenylate/guanylate cyclase domain-containing protein [Spelaeibacter cavernicola]KAA0016327.1 adenylate/guanylate cyclase domain-containing protein [Spelaeibacter cavernicola]
MASMVFANGFGAVLVFAFIRHGLPIPETTSIVQDRSRNVVIFATLLAIGGAISLTAAAMMLRPVVRWQLRGGPPSRREQLATLHAPLRQALIHLVLWLIGGAVFSALTISAAPSIAFAVILTVCMASTLVFGFTYMLGERILRPVAASAMSQGRFEEGLTPGIWTRMAMTWGLGTLAPTIGIVLLCVTQISTKMDFSANALAIAILLLAVVVIMQALALTMLTSTSISDPIRQLTRAIEQVQNGSQDVQVEVFDGSEIGRLQVGFNRMMEDAAERTVLKELFGQHVGEDVARRALEYGTDLGGETRFVAVLFVDMVGSTAAAAERPPSEVVTLLNEFFRVVVEVVDKHNGFVNKFVGDAALAIFGAPLDRPDAPTAALAAARDLRCALDSVAGLDIGIGVSAGLAVAGNIGGANRFEYTVIGDPVNEASRLTELAKDRPSRVLASSSALYFAEDDEQRLWELGDEVQLRGRRRKTHLAWPVPSP